ncbi:hypothetical protein Tco_0298166, partial [Tanacetum coccineum]
DKIDAGDSEKEDESDQDCFELPIWHSYNVQRVNKQNQFVPLAVQTRTGNNPVNTAKASSTNPFSTARQNVNRQTVLTSTALKVNTVKPIVNGMKSREIKKTGSSIGCSWVVKSQRECRELPCRARIA